MTSLRRNRIHGWIVPAIVSLAAAFALAMPGLARADDTSQATAATPATAVTATTATDNSSAVAADPSATTDPSDWGAVAQPNAASWR
jgi:hypothetical protein